LRLNPPTEGFPWDDLRKIFTVCQCMTKVPENEEKLPKISTDSVGCTNVTARRQTTDGTAMAYSELEHKFTFAKMDTRHPVESHFGSEFQSVIIAELQRPEVASVFGKKTIPYT